MTTGQRLDQLSDKIIDLVLKEYLIVHDDIRCGQNMWIIPYTINEKLKVSFIIFNDCIHVQKSNKKYNTNKLVCKLRKNQDIEEDNFYDKIYSYFNDNKS